MIGDTLTDSFWEVTLPNALAVSSARVPTLFAYYAALNLLDARVLFSHLKVATLLDPTAHAKKAALERHHLFPRKYLAKIGIHDVTQQNQVANFALVEWRDNIEISDTAPAEYLPKYLARFKPESDNGEDFQPEDLAAMYYWHAQPDGWEHMEYSQFLEARRLRMAAVIRDAYAYLVTGVRPKYQPQSIALPPVITVKSERVDAVHRRPVGEGEPNEGQHGLELAILGIAPLQRPLNQTTPLLTERALPTWLQPALRRRRRAPKCRAPDTW